VVDFVLQMATVTEESVSAEELMRDPDEDGGPAGASPAVGASES
jgi:hypothetical protein